MQIALISEVEYYIEYSRTLVIVSHPSVAGRDVALLHRLVLVTLGLALHLLIVVCVQIETTSP